MAKFMTIFMIMDTKDPLKNGRKGVEQCVMWWHSLAQDLEHLAQYEHRSTEELGQGTGTTRLEHSAVHGSWV